MLNFQSIIDSLEDEIHIEIDSTKCKPRNNEEVLFQAKVNEEAIKAIKEHNLPITHIRWGRQVKSWGSTGVADYHVYEYYCGKKEFWINMHHMSGYDAKELVWALMRGCFRFIKTEEEIAKRAAAADVTYYKMLHPNRGFKNDKKLNKLREHLASKIFADEITGLNKAFE